MCESMIVRACVRVIGVRVLMCDGLLRLGAWVLGPEFVYASLEKMKWVNEEPYEVKSDAFPGAPISRKAHENEGTVWRCLWRLCARSFSPCLLPFS